MNLWDKKAKTYARYNESLNQIQKDSFKEFKKLNIDFKDKFIIDIGCGTGVWTLHFAKSAKEILALDSSKTMLEILSQDALNLDINNIKCQNLSFDLFCKENSHFKCDIAFLSMSPALQNDIDYKNFISLAPLRIYLGWADYRKSDFLDPIFKHFNTEFKGFYKKDLESFLLRENIKFHKVIFNEIRIVERNREEAIENALWHLDMNGVKADKKILENLVKEEIKEKIESKIKLLIF
ncbi:class I SAM-dependent methyltransferase [Campylobacter sp. TTU-622]|uniref:methyltransferase domain-containing protein n=1 Tax=Campylobacter sp. TTU-622 TaxID=2800583 RepID=UPI0019057231|nr:class I SAM-dependent methyltransferase [Campylobacter sp. TTU-622]MBK1972712.1 class I SAM-dependent methyltransferase [Campylobacter sp. TTU-622]